VVVVRPERNEVERQLSRWAQYFVDDCSPSVIDLRGPAADARAVEDALVPNSLTVYWGHGTQDLLGDPPLIGRHNIARCRGGIVVAIAGWSALGLGQYAVSPEVGVAAYLGFTDRFLVPAGPYGLGQLTARALVKLVRGHTVDEGLKTLDRGLKLLAERSLIVPDPEAVVPEWFVAQSIRSGLAVLGDPDFRLP